MLKLWSRSNCGENCPAQSQSSYRTPPPIRPTGIRRVPIRRVPIRWKLGGWNTPNPPTIRSRGNDDGTSMTLTTWRLRGRASLGIMSRFEGSRQVEFIIPYNNIPYSTLSRLHLVKLSTENLASTAIADCCTGSKWYFVISCLAYIRR